MSRQSRKLDHVRLAAAERAGDSGFDHVHLVHAALPGGALEQVDLSTALAGRELPAPLIINAMTGGAGAVGEINRQLAEVAARFGLAMAVGSQTAALKDPAVASTYAVVRETHPKGVILANLSANASVDDARRAVQMLGADLLQVHLNATQELIMPEGDRDFSRWLANIERLVVGARVPVLVKEVGFGLSAQAVQQLAGVGVRMVDVGGRGGTNFARIEARRAAEGGGQPEYALDPGLEAWGIPTACALAEVVALGLPGLAVVASGGIAHGSEAAKALALGACAVGVAGPLLRAILRGGEAEAAAYVETFLLNLRRTMLLAGAVSLAALAHQPVVLFDWVGQWCAVRGVDVDGLARRRPTQE